ncbi:MAG: response regulator transcription factor [Chitinophagaceae bacterium]|nr:response regulator transcription factor [Chitinophagaceae bacterium]
MINAIIIDDEQNCIDTLSFDLGKYCPEVQLLACCTSPKEGLIAIKQLKPDLVFLDVQMPWMNGFEMLEILESIDFAIIFTTAFDQFAAKAFRLSAIDYLLKPIDVTDLKEAVKKAAERIQLKTGSDHIDNLLRNIRQAESSQRVAFPGRDGYEFIEVNNIIYAQAEGAYTCVFLKDNRKVLISRTLSDIEEMLPPASFLRIHHSTLVNTLHVTHFLRTDGGYIIMNNNVRLSISKSKKEKVMEKLGLK